MMGLGNLGLGEVAEANAQFKAVLALDRNHVGTLVHEHLLKETSL